MDRETAATYLTTGDRLKRAGKLKEAIASYKRAIEINPHFAWSHHNLGEALAKTGLLDEAIVSFRKAIEINPKSAWSYYELGEVFATKGEVAAAIPNYRRACELEPDFERFSRGLEKALGKLGDRPQIPEKGLGFFEKAKTHFANRLWQETITSCRQAIAAGVEDLECYKMLAWSLKKRRQWEEAIAAYSKLIEINPTYGDGYYFWGDILKIQGKLGEAIAVYEKGLEQLPEEPQLTVRLQRIKAEEKTLKKQPSSPNIELEKYRSLAATQKRLGKWEAAIAAYRQGIAIEPNNRDYHQLGKLLLEQKQLDEALFCYEKLLAMQPWVGSQVKHFLSLGVALAKEGKLQELIDCYHRVFRKSISNLEFYAGFGIRLSGAGLIKEAVEFFKEWPRNKSFPTKELEPASESNNNCQYDLIWQKFNQTNFADKIGEIKSSLNPEDLAEKSGKIYAYFQERPLEILIIQRLTDADKIALLKKGISLEYVKLIKIENNNLENIYLNGFNGDRPPEDLIEKNRIRPHKNFQCYHRINSPVEFVDTIVEFNYMYAFDPISGNIIRSNESFFMGSSTIIYRFVGREVFYILVGTYTGEKLSVFFPKWDLVLCYADYFKHDSRFYINLKAYVVSYFSEVIEYINSSQTRLLTSTVGFIKNLGHFFWQDLNGIYYSYQNQLLDRIDILAVGDYEPLEVTSIIPEKFQSKKVKLPEMSDEETFRFFLKKNSLCVRITEHFMSKDYVARISEVALEKCSENFRKMVREIKEKQESFPLLWLNVRHHNKSWVSQSEGYANILNKLSEDFPNLGVVVDGWIDCNEVLEKIASQLKPNIKIYNTLGCPLHESIIWGAYIDAYIAVIGSGLVITSWLNDKPGVAYGNRGHIKHRVFWSKVKEKAIAPSFLDFEEVKELGVGGGSNYEINWEVIYNKILPILKQL